MSGTTTLGVQLGKTTLAASVGAFAVLSLTACSGPGPHEYDDLGTFITSLDLSSIGEVSCAANSGNWGKSGGPGRAVLLSGADAPTLYAQLEESGLELESSTKTGPNSTWSAIGFAVNVVTVEAGDTIDNGAGPCKAPTGGIIVGAIDLDR